MAVKKTRKRRKINKKRVRAQKPRIVKKPLISSKVRARLVAIRGDKRRRMRDPKTGRTYSRRQFEKGRIRPARKNAPQITIRLQKFYTVVEIHMHAYEFETKREAIESMRGYSRRGAWVDLHSSDTPTRQKAWEFITNGEREEWVPYIQRWIKGSL